MIPNTVVQQVIISNQLEGAPFGKWERGHILPLRSLIPARGTSEMHHFPGAVCSNAKPSLFFDSGLLTEQRDAPALAKWL